MLESVNPAHADSRTLWLVRHGESSWNQRGLIQGHADGPVLTEKGRSQSLAAANELADHALEAIYASDLERAQQTATIIGAAIGLPVQSHPALRERCFGVLEGRPLTTLTPLASGIRDERIVDVSARPESGESLEDLHQRVLTFLGWLQDQNHTEDVALVTHGGTIRALRACGAGQSMFNRPWDEVPNGSVWNVRQPAVMRATKC